MSVYLFAKFIFFFFFFGSANRTRFPISLQSYSTKWKVRCTGKWRHFCFSSKYLGGVRSGLAEGAFLRFHSLLHPCVKKGRENGSSTQEVWFIIDLSRAKELLTSVSRFLKQWWVTLQVDRDNDNDDRRRVVMGPPWLWTPGFPGGSDGQESACNAGDVGLIPGLGRPPGEGNGYPLQYSFLENSMDRGAWWATVHRVTKSWTRLSN